jgi:ketosteroid isomerase-like protein
MTCPQMEGITHDRRICLPDRVCKGREEGTMSTRNVISSYYDSLNRQDNTWQDLWSEDAVFSDASKTLAAKGKTQVIQSFTPFLKGVERVQVKQMIVEGDRACALASYDYVNPKGEKLNQDVAEVFQVEDGELAELTIYFDLTAYRNFMRR